MSNDVFQSSSLVKEIGKAQATISAFLGLLLPVLSSSPIWASQWPPLIDLSPGHDTANATILGGSGLDQLGGSLASGDINGDNATDVLVLAASASPMGRTYAGLLCILWGPVPTGTINLEEETVPRSFIIPPVGAFGLYSSVDCGDFNRDGYDDIVLGIPCDYPSFNCRGRTLIVFGRASFPSTVDLQSPSVDVTTVLGSTADQGWLGYAATHGDMNGDTYDDIVLSAPAHNPGGHVYIIQGKSSFAQTIDLNVVQTGVTRLIESASGWGAGQSLACADVNGDSADDLLIGEPGESGPTTQGKAILFYGSSNLPTLLTLTSSTPGTKHISGDTSQPGALGTGSALVDFDGDGELDVILSASGAGLSGCSECGLIYVLYSADSLPVALSVTSANLPITCVVGNLNWRMGLVMSAGDFNDDGRADVAASAVQSGSGENLKVVVVYGIASRPNTIVATNPTLTTIINGESDDDNFGWTLMTSDINNDGTSDLSIGADFANVSPNFGSGKVYAFYGIDGPTGMSRTPSPPLTVRTFPTPSTGSITIAYSLPGPGDVSISIYDVQGRHIAQLGSGHEGPGDHLFSWNGRDENGVRLPSGVYFYRLSDGISTAQGKVLIVR